MFYLTCTGPQGSTLKLAKN